VRRGFHSSNARLRYADLTLDRHRRRATRDKETIPLTSREFALLELLLLRAPELITRSEIVEHVWDCHFDSETNLVEVYINRLRQKIDQDRSVKLIHTIRGVGYRLGTPGS
jgi:two-component system, OmpR family, copper resistance phosphate regulon response regulator CusR